MAADDCAGGTGMNILIVDDEILSVEGITRSLDWAALGIENVYPAYGMQQAIHVFEQHPIDILLCDIEMPRGNGIELMEWVRNSGQEPVCVFLTSFSTFEYAQSSVRLQMFDYVLKPCEYPQLQKVLGRAVEKRKESLRQKQLGYFWQETESKRTAAFWNEVLQANIPLTEDALRREIRQRHLDEKLLTCTYAMLLVCILPGSLSASAADPEEILRGSDWIVSRLCPAASLRVDNAFLALIDMDEKNKDEMALTVRELLEQLSEEQGVTGLGYLYAPVYAEDIMQGLTALHDDSRRMHALQSRLYIHGKDYRPLAVSAFSAHTWEKSLLSGQTESIVQDIRQVFQTLSPQEYIDQATLSTLYHQLMSVIHQLFQENQIKGTEYLKTSTPMETSVLTSAFSFLSWAREVTAQAFAALHSSQSDDSVVATMIKYIQSHLNEDLNRSELSQIVHLNADYMSTVFKQQTGMNLIDYITQARIREAEKLLLSTMLPISEIAMRTGFQTISYFSKQFKRTNGKTPYQYRKENVLQKNHMK